MGGAFKGDSGSPQETYIHVIRRAYQARLAALRALKQHFRTFDQNSN
ncbi:hypothetical protein SAMN05880582_101995 [Rhizobium sp. RU20A]|nr:hypothetical protein SAMN05880582_101995 [Rhizobium sp. RU20A]